MSEAAQAPELLTWRLFDTGEALAQALAVEVAQTLAAALAFRGRASLAVSGGSTPRAFFDALSLEAFDWRGVDIVLTDERWVEAGSPRANSTLLRGHLLQNAATAARFVDLKTSSATPEEGLAEAQALFETVSLPLAVVVLGMGEDGHTASFFPQGDRLAEALRPSLDHKLEFMHAPQCDEPRLTLTFPVLAEAGRRFLHIEGAKKRETFLRAEKSGRIEDMPIRAFLRDGRPLEVFWRP